MTTRRNGQNRGLGSKRVGLAVRLLDAYTQALTDLDYETRQILRQVVRDVREHNAERLSVNANMLAILARRRSLLASLLEDDDHE